MQDYAQSLYDRQDYLQTQRVVERMLQINADYAPALGLAKKLQVTRITFVEELISYIRSGVHFVINGI